MNAAARARWNDLQTCCHGHNAPLARGLAGPLLLRACVSHDSDDNELWRAPSYRGWWIGASATAVVLFLLFGLARAWETCGFHGCPDVRELSRAPARAAPRCCSTATASLSRTCSPPSRAWSSSRRCPPRARRVPRGRGPALPRARRRRLAARRGRARANLRARAFDQGFSTITMQLARNVFPERIPGRAADAQAQAARDPRRARDRADATARTRSSSST